VGESLNVLGETWVKILTLWGDAFHWSMWESHCVTSRWKLSVVGESSRRVLGDVFHWSMWAFSLVYAWRVTVLTVWG